MHLASPFDERQLRHLSDELFIATDRREWAAALGSSSTPERT